MPEKDWDVIRLSPEKAARPEVERLAGVMDDMSKLLAVVRDAASAREVAPRHRKMREELSARFRDAGQPDALGSDGFLARPQPLTRLGKTFREAYRRYIAEWTRVRDSPGVLKALTSG